MTFSSSCARSGLGISRLLVAREKLTPFGYAAVVRTLLYAAEYNPDLSTQHTACQYNTLINVTLLFFYKVS